MNNKTSLALLIAGFALAGSSTAAAQAQTQKAFVDINGGAQPQSRSFKNSTSFPLYGETAAVNSSQAVDGGGLFDMSAGYRVWSRLSVAAGFSMLSKSGEGVIVASIPDPVVFNNPHVVTTQGTGLKHKETATHLMAVWSRPVNDKLEATIFAGPSFFRLTQDVLGATVAAGSTTATVTTVSEKATATGANVGVNLNYMYKPNYGGGIFLRYAGATAKLASVGDMKVGGFQFGIGARLRF